MGSPQARENVQPAKLQWRCPSCLDVVPARLAVGALACTIPQHGTLALGMDRPVHKCMFMPKWAEAQAMQELALMLKKNVNWRDSRSVQQHLAYGPIMGYSDSQDAVGAVHKGPRVWRWIPRQIAYEAGLPEYVN